MRLAPVRVRFYGNTPEESQEAQKQRLREDVEPYETGFRGLPGFR